MTYSDNGNSHPGRSHLTVCIAAISKDGFIFGAADRMLSAADVEFEPPTPKVYELTGTIFLMTAGDSALQTEIIETLSYWIAQRDLEEPAKVWSVKEIAELYVRFYNEAKLMRSEATILAPLGLNRNTFLERQRQMADEFIASVTKELINFDMPIVETIVAGADPTGAHIFTIIGGRVDCFDAIGFASIGSGSRHADSQFMLARYSRQWDIPAAIWLVFTAKRRAEVAPGVGTETDMVILGPGWERPVMIRTDLIDDLAKMYEANADKENKMREEAQQEVRQYFDKITQQPAEQPGATGPQKADG